MKTLRIELPASLLAAAVLLAVAAPARAVDADAAQALARRSNCMKCHAIDKAKKGSSYQKTAAKYKGKADGEAKVTDSITKGPRVKFEDGTEEDHKVIESKDAKEIKNLVQWILAQ